MQKQIPLTEEKAKRFDIIDAIHLRTANSPAADMSDEALMGFIDECIHEVRKQVQKTPGIKTD